MATHEEYRDRVKLLARCLPSVYPEECFALKGGSAINFYLKDMPRLSVDIDLAYLPIKEREESLKDMSDSLHRIAQNIEQSVTGATAKPNRMSRTPYSSRVWVEQDGVAIKIEVSPVLRGSLNEPVIANPMPAAKNEFDFPAMRLLHPNDIYAGKICAAVDRQHPRDLFDIKYLLQDQGISKDLKNSYLVYLISGRRPMVEMLNPTLKNVDHVYGPEFTGMCITEVPLKELYDARKKLFSKLDDKITDKDRRFLLSFKKGEPRWSLFAHPEAQHLPAVRWKLINIQKMDREKWAAAYNKLEHSFKARDKGLER
jgi:hypothetical protein